MVWCERPNNFWRTVHLLYRLKGLYNSCPYRWRISNRHRAKSPSFRRKNFCNSAVQRLYEESLYCIWKLEELSKSISCIESTTTRRTKTKVSWHTNFWRQRGRKEIIHASVLPLEIQIISRASLMWVLEKNCLDALWAQFFSKHENLAIDITVTAIYNKAVPWSRLCNLHTRCD